METYLIILVIIWTVTSVGLAIVTANYRKKQFKVQLEIMEAMSRRISILSDVSSTQGEKISCIVDIIKKIDDAWENSGKNE